MSLQTKKFYEFSNFRLDLSEKVLLHNGKSVPLTPKVFYTLQVLVENAGHLLEKDFLMKKIWQDRFVEESNLTFNIKMLRKALGDNAANPQFIETIPKRGYRFIGEVNEVSNEIDNEQPVSLVNEPIRIDDNAPKSRKLLISIGVAIVFFVGTIAVGSWFLQNGNLIKDAAILNAPFASDKLSTNGKVMHAIISSDGKSVVYAKGIEDRQSIWIRELESGNNVEIIPPSDDIYTGLAISPDDKILYFVRRPKSKDETAVFRVSIFGGIPEKILKKTEGWISISSDGAKISFVRCFYKEDEFCSLWVADSVDGKNEKKIASRPRPFRIADNEISPDGKTVTFAVGQSENQANEFGLVEVNIESGKESEITKEKFFNIKNLIWLPDRSGLLITASRIPNKHFRIWLVSPDSGEVEPLTKDSETYSTLSLDKEAKYLVSTQIKQDFYLYLFDLKDSSKKILADATHARFSPDGKIIFSSSMSGNDEIWSINSDGNGQKQLTNDPADDSRPVISPKGDKIYFSSNRTGEVHIWQMDFDGSDQIQVTHKEGGFPIDVSQDGKWIYYHHGRDRTLWRVAAKDGEEQLVFNKAKYLFAISNDGSQFAYSEREGDRRILTIASISDGRTMKTFRLSDTPNRILEIVWLADGKNIAYTSANSEFEDNILWLQTFNSEMPEKIADLGNEDTNSLTFSPDGKKFAIVQGGWKHDAVLLKGLK